MLLETLAIGNNFTKIEVQDTLPILAHLALEQLINELHVDAAYNVIKCRGLVLLSYEKGINVILCDCCC